MSINAGNRNQLKAIVGFGGWIEDAADTERYQVDYRNAYGGSVQLVLRPSSTLQVSNIVAVCADACIPIVPQGGNTSLVGGSVPRASGETVLVSLERMNRIREVAPRNAAITVEAGCTLAAVQAAATAAGAFFPLRMGSEGACQIGGNLSTNAGGTNVLRYGSTRDLTLGLEVVLPDGSVWDGLRALRKNNTGYDLKHLFIGAEGTLGIITAAVLKLHPAPRSVQTAFLAVPSIDAAIDLLNLAKTSTGDLVTAFEIMGRASLELAIPRLAGGRSPISLGIADWFVLLEVSSGFSEAALGEMLTEFLAGALERHLVRDAVVASSVAQGRSFWSLREEISDAQTAEGGTVRCDISVPMSRIAEFIELASEEVNRLAPSARIIAYGHIGDGNVHFNPLCPRNADPDDFLALSAQIREAVNQVAHFLGGSISAEHGIGQANRDDLPRYKSTIEYELFRKLKRMLDPQAIMNPGKLLVN